IDGAIIVPHGLNNPALNLIYSNDPIKHHIETTKLLHDPPGHSCSIHPDASVSEKATIGDGVTIDARSVIYEHVSIGKNTIIRAGVVIMANTGIGQDSLIYPNVTIRENCQIGDRVIIHAGAVIGADGFGYYQREGINLKIPQIGRVVIGDDVEIGAGTTIDRARFGETIIGSGSKLDNLIHVAHNVQLGEHALIAAQSGIAGSVKIGHHLMMGGQSGIRDNLKIGNGVTLFARTLITSKTDDHEIVAGMPSRPIKVWRQIQALINSLDNLFERVKRLEKRFTSKGEG
ncbi:UDP-3-O-(3-hydroxymyristoyl)glucosamine N-acyltransferase, partial [bacterium]|nr:UDP-3-O-(3-hydroxymyristoyl)glucosamine N-acyltransferase [bacterium]